KYLDKLGIPCRYIHSEIDTLERIEILHQLRMGDFDVLIGVNLLREGLDLPEVSLVAILDADKEGFLRNERSLVQTVGRAARNVNGFVIMYADTITKSMQRTIDETARRRTIQMKYNEEHGIVPKPLNKSKEKMLVIKSDKTKDDYNSLTKPMNIAAESPAEYKSKVEQEKQIQSIKKAMEKAAKELDFIEAARLRDLLFELQAQMKS
ncbi:MAG TPA: helicase-related protein, partial [Taishania sp.]|nr:helicase-related protein [Taishania sp.]